MISRDQAQREQEEAGAEGQKARYIDTDCVRISRLAHGSQDDPDDDDAHRDVDIERPLPSEFLRNEPAHDRAERHCDADHGAPEGKGAGALGAPEPMRQDCQRGAQLQCCSKALKRARYIEDQHGGRGSADQRSERENGEPRDEHPLAAIAIRQRARRHHQRGEHEGVGADHPLDRREVGMQRAGDRRQRHRHDVRVQIDHEGGYRHAQQHHQFLGAAQRVGMPAMGHDLGRLGPQMAHLTSSTSGLPFSTT